MAQRAETRIIHRKKKIVGKAKESGHIIPEQNPKQTIIQLRNYLLKQI